MGFTESDISVNSISLDILNAEWVFTQANGGYSSVSNNGQIFLSYGSGQSCSHLW
ncbi:hypothetical protein Bhyg_00401 [Pseudolycoriella hygida]|uniref:Uncharacterized protein n=1 Tax=Pseudolycoriella hygida TaxID=35572 RepID=A0A9Q0N7H8_9DIPT|nr:hypothetical protein Bhyg_00401 [Pseudolycoriella hygida]